MRHGVKTHTVHLKSGRSVEFSLFDTKLCPTVCCEVLNGESYPLLPQDVLPPDSVKVIYDVGANIGASCIYWCDSYPNAKVYAFEPCADAYELFTKNTAHFNVEPYNIALGGDDGFGDLYHSVEDDVCNSLMPHNSHGHEKVVIERARHHITPCDIMKLDVEGCELEILSDIEAWNRNIKVIYLEYHNEYNRHKIDELLKRTHTLWYSRSDRPHRGNLCYVRTDLIPLSYANWVI